MSGIEVSGLAKTLGARVALPVLRGVTFRVAAGHCLGLRGATGAGKTTLLRIIAGLDRPDRGEVRLEGRLVTGPRVQIPPAQRGLGFVFQSLGLWPHLTVAGHLEYVLAAGKRAPDTSARRKAELVETFHLRGMERRYPAELSGGERHLLALARALAGEVRVLLLDEPFAGLDGRLKELVIEALARVQAARGLTTILVSHEPADLARLCQGVVSLQEGRVVEMDRVIR